MFVWVIEQNPSIIFYQAYSPERVAEDNFEIDRVRLKEVGLGWPHLSALKTILNR
ncbi:putative acetyl-transferase [Bacillus subtilis XF-1]|nr:putative acetyl-transferase [Bacillus subtilis XF-1]